MKKVLASAVVVGLLSAAGAVYAGLPAATGVNGSLHDMNYFVGGNADSMGRVCVFCHTPHHAQTNGAGNTDPTNNKLSDLDVAPLWDRPGTQLTYTAYQWVTPANAGTDDDPLAFQILDPLAGPSRLCMSCHDGVVAVDSHNSTMAQSGNRKVTDRANLGGDLTTTHPIGFSYTAIRDHRQAISNNGTADGDTEIVDPSKGFAIAIDTNVPAGTYNKVTRSATGKRIKDVLFGGSTMTCASCHEVHNKENAIQDPYAAVAANITVTTPPTIDGTNAPNYFLYAKETNSLICLSCHVK